MPASAIPGVGKSAYELLTSIGRGGGVRALLVMGSNIAVSAPNASARVRAAEGARVPRGRGLLSLGDGRTGRRRAAVHAVGGGRRHADQPRGPRAAAAEGRGTARRRPLRPRDPQRARPAPRASAPVSRTRTAKRCSRSCAARVTAAPRTTSASRTSASKPSRACSGRVRRSVTRARSVCSRTRFRRRTAARAFTPSRIDRSARTRTRNSRSTSRPAAILAQYQSGTQTRRVRALDGIASQPFVEMHPATARVSRRGCRRSRRAHDQARLGDVRREDDDVDSRRHGVRAVPLGRRAVREPADQRRARSDQQDARVQGLRDADRAG